MLKINKAEIIREFIRYVFVGGISFVLDYYTLVLFHEILIPKVYGSLYIANTLGFLVGVTCNYLLSVKYVFLQAKKTGKGQSGFSKLLFVVIGIIGLMIHQLGMYVGVDQLLMNYKMVKIVMTGVVLVWNFLARKYLIFENAQL